MVGRVTAPDGTELVLYSLGDDFQIRVDGLELVTSRAHGSEEALARLACAEIAHRIAPKVLVGGLGFGYTLRAALDALPRSATILVSEVLPAVVEWNRGPVAELAGSPLEDERVTVIEGDVADLLRSAAAPFDAILLDVDNGPRAPTLERNQALYTAKGLEEMMAALTPGGILAIWSASPDDDLLRRLRAGVGNARTESVPARSDGTGPTHTLFLAHPKPQ